MHRFPHRVRYAALYVKDGLYCEATRCGAYWNCLLSPGGAIKKPLYDLVVANSQTAVLECEVANPTTEGKWLKDGNRVDFNENTLSEVTGAVRRLVIVITKATDVGEYTYQVATSKTSATLKVEGGSSLRGSPTRRNRF